MVLPERFIYYRLVPKPDTTKMDKIPCNAAGESINPHDPSQWMTRAAADAGRTNAVMGIGFVLNGDGWFAIDFDNCWDATAGEWNAAAVAIYQSFNGALAEVSVSGTGLHIFGRCDPARLADRRNKWDGWCEWYHTGRFIALGPQGLQPIGGTWVDRDWTDQLLHFVPQRADANSVLPEGVDPTYTGPEDDDTLIAMMLGSSGSAAVKFGEKASVADLWSANTAVLSRFYPPYDGGKGFDHSSADAALMAHLAFWTGKDMPRMDRLFRRSALMRDKYAKREDYRRETIQGAARMCKNVYSVYVKAQGDGPSTCHADMSQDELALNIFEQRWAGQMLYIPERDLWAEWKEEGWQLLKTHNSQITRLRHDLRNIPCEDLKKRKNLGDNRTIMAINALMKTNPGAGRSIDQWDNDPLVLGTPTQVADLKTGEVRPKKRSDYLLRSVLVDPSERGARPQNWLNFLDVITDGDAEIQDFLQNLSGYAATGSTKEHKLFFAFGTGRNGKSTLLNTLAAILTNDYACVVPPKLLLDKKMEQHATDLALLSGARLARASELPVGKVWDEALLKQITGGDRMTARFMRQDNFTFTPQCTLIVDANNAPSVRGIDEAFRRRMCVIPFDVTITKAQVDPDLPSKLMLEAPEILRWIIEGAVNWYENGLKMPARILQATEEYLNGEDTFGAFLSEYFVADSDGMIANSEIQSQFEIYTHSVGLSTWTATSISKEMCKRGYKPFRSDSKRGFRGLRLRNSQHGFVHN
jgi:P4 family phage/plasmid primase-like protien